MFPYNQSRKEHHLQRSKEMDERLWLGFLPLEHCTHMPTCRPKLAVDAPAAAAEDLTRHLGRPLRPYGGPLGRGRWCPTMHCGDPERRVNANRGVDEGSKNCDEGPEGRGVG